MKAQVIWLKKRFNHKAGNKLRTYKNEVNSKDFTFFAGLKRGEKKQGYLVIYIVRKDRNG